MYIYILYELNRLVADFFFEVGNLVAKSRQVSLLNLQELLGSSLIASSVTKNGPLRGRFNVE